MWLAVTSHFSDITSRRVHKWDTPTCDVPNTGIGRSSKQLVKSEHTHTWWYIMVPLRVKIGNRQGLISHITFTSTTHGGYGRWHCVFICDIAIGNVAIDIVTVERLPVTYVTRVTRPWAPPSAPDHSGSLRFRGRPGMTSSISLSPPTTPEMNG